MVYFLDVYFEGGYSKGAQRGDLLYIGRCDDVELVEQSDYIYFHEGEKRTTNLDMGTSYEHVRFISEMFRNFPWVDYNRYEPSFEVKGIMLSYSPIGTYWDFNHCTLANPVHEERFVANSSRGVYEVVSARTVGIIKLKGGGFKSMTAELEAGEKGLKEYDCHTKVYINNAFLIFNKGADPSKNRWRKLPHNYNKGKTIDFTVDFNDRSSAKEVAPAYARRPAPSAPPPGY